MPIYEYRCPNGHTFEVFQRMSDPAVTACETCGASPVEKLLFPVAVHFKGSGFYSTDYGRGGRKASEGRRLGGVFGRRRKDREARAGRRDEEDGHEVVRLIAVELTRAARPRGSPARTAGRAEVGAGPSAP